ncbi:hypothetical protein OB2597_13878 [Pseudooceanicola batsensis HTCC2597]|uniref:Type I secretion system ATPase n=2 Tax=Pseudooceanicola batsensis TaxID=314255 RepID=A3TYK4_PSEBH|nr:hypothetical protein OB2597_13878 [Pseudooceanicola batsensis HTCC2597]
MKDYSADTERNETGSPAAKASAGKGLHLPLYLRVDQRVNLDGTKGRFVSRRSSVSDLAIELAKTGVRPVASVKGGKTSGSAGSFTKRFTLTETKSPRSAAGGPQSDTGAEPDQMTADLSAPEKPEAPEVPQQQVAKTDGPDRDTAPRPGADADVDLDAGKPALRPAAAVRTSTGLQVAMERINGPFASPPAAPATETAVSEPPAQAETASGAQGGKPGTATGGEGATQRSGQAEQVIADSPSEPAHTDGTGAAPGCDVGRAEAATERPVPAGSSQEDGNPVQTTMPQTAVDTAERADDARAGGSAADPAETQIKPGAATAPSRPLQQAVHTPEPAKATHPRAETPRTSDTADAKATPAPPAGPTRPSAPETATGTTQKTTAPPEHAGHAPQEARVTVPEQDGATEPVARGGGDRMGETIEGDTGPIMRRKDDPPPGGGDGGRPPPPKFHRRKGPQDFGENLRTGTIAVRRNLFIVMILTLATNLLILSIPIYLFQISDRVLTSRSTDTLVMLTVIIVGAVVLQTCFDALRRFILMRTAVEVAVRLGASILSAAAHASLHGTGREYQTLGDLQQLRGFLTSGTLLAFLDVPFAPLFVLAIYLVHPHLGSIVVISALLLALVAFINQRLTHKPFSEANQAQSRANGHLESMSRNSQIINALAMIPEAVTIWGRDTAASLTAQVRAQDRNIVMSAVSRAVRLLTQVAMLGWGAYLAIDGQITGGMVIAASIIAGRALAPIEGSIEGWNAFIIARQAYDRIRTLLTNSTLQFEKLNLPQPEGRLDVERLLYVPSGTKHVVLNSVSFSLNPGESLAVIGNSGAGKTTLGKMLVGSVLPTSGNVRLDLMDLRNWDPRQFGENIGYLPQDVQLFPGTIKDNIGRMRRDATDAQVYRAAMLADVHEMIANLPHGYETWVQADGFPLSGGQKQRIALARAFFGDPRFVVLDEPNSNLDTKGDKALSQALQHARRNKITVVVITQKPSLLSAVDKIMLLADGSVQMFGERTPILQELAGRKSPQPRVPEQPRPQNLPKGNTNV